MIFRHLLNMRSHPTWVRGLKLLWHILTIKDSPVAPYVGAWIETSGVKSVEAYKESHPTWVRGLKPGRTSHRRWATSVAPYVGAWIETDRLRWSECCPWSHPTWVRGLKHIEGNINVITKGRTLRGCVD